jgi:hypothetical protein
MQGREKLNGPLTGQVAAVPTREEARREEASSQAFFDQDLD